MIYAIEPVDDTPEFGTVPLSVTACASCGHLMIVEHDLTLREPTTDELRKAAKHPDVVAEIRSAINWTKARLLARSNSLPFRAPRWLPMSLFVCATQLKMVFWRQG
jgi:hypothetical protein